MDESEAGVPTTAIFVLKIHDTILDVIRLYPTDIDVVQSIFWVLVGRMKVSMNSLSKYYYFCHTIVTFFTLPIFFPFFCTNLW